MRIYLSGPISLNGRASPGQIVDNLEAFARESRALRAEGHEVLSPAELSKQDSWEGYMKMCLPMVCRADRVVVLPGWEQSRGALLEVFVANQLGIEVEVRDGGRNR